MTLVQIGAKHCVERSNELNLVETYRTEAFRIAEESPVYTTPSLAGALAFRHVLKSRLGTRHY